MNNNCLTFKEKSDGFKINYDFNLYPLLNIK